LGSLLFVCYCFLMFLFVDMKGDYKKVLLNSNVTSKA
jgi:hypothetical protein